MTSKQHIEMKRLWAQGFLVKAIAQKLGVKVGVVTSHAQYFRDEFPARRRSPFTKNEVWQMKQMRESGATYREIAEHFGCSIDAAWRNAKHVG